MLITLQARNSPHHSLRKRDGYGSSYPNRPGSHTFIGIFNNTYIAFYLHAITPPSRDHVSLSILRLSMTTYPCLKLREFSPMGAHTQYEGVDPNPAQSNPFTSLVPQTLTMEAIEESRTSEEVENSVH